MNKKKIEFNKEFCGASVWFQFQLEGVDGGAAVLSWRTTDIEIKTTIFYFLSKKHLEDVVLNLICSHSIGTDFILFSFIFLVSSSIDQSESHGESDKKTMPLRLFNLITWENIERKRGRRAFYIKSDSRYDFAESLGLNGRQQIHFGIEKKIALSRG